VQTAANQHGSGAERSRTVTSPGSSRHQPSPTSLGASVTFTSAKRTLSVLRSRRNRYNQLWNEPTFNPRFVANWTCVSPDSSNSSTSLCHCSRVRRFISTSWVDSPHPRRSINLCFRARRGTSDGYTAEVKDNCAQLRGNVSRSSGGRISPDGSYSVGSRPTRICGGIEIRPVRYTGNSKGTDSSARIPLARSNGATDHLPQGTGLH